MLNDFVEAYRRTRKPRDILWNRFVARPLAAVALVPLARTSVTPNQVTLLTLVVFVAGAVVLAIGASWKALVLGAVVIELSYVLDCVDGQLARWKGTSSPVGAHLDFLMDELKAFLLVAATGVRLWRADQAAHWLLESLLALVAVASAVSLTTFLRRPEYVAASGAAVGHGAGDYGEGFDAAPPPPARWSPLRLVESIGRLVVHYPSYILFVAVANRMDIFLRVYAVVNAAYAARALLGIARRLGRSA
jgi:phosphatidylglycerophosphate synthase